MNAEFKVTSTRIFSDLHGCQLLHKEGKNHSLRRNITISELLTVADLKDTGDPLQLLNFVVVLGHPNGIFIPENYNEIVQPNTLARRSDRKKFIYDYDPAPEVTQAMDRATQARATITIGTGAPDSCASLLMKTLKRNGRWDLLDPLFSIGMTYSKLPPDLAMIWPENDINSIGTKWIFLNALTMIDQAVPTAAIEDSINCAELFTTMGVRVFMPVSREEAERGRVGYLPSSLQDSIDQDLIHFGTPVSEAFDIVAKELSRCSSLRPTACRPAFVS